VTAPRPASKLSHGRNACDLAHPSEHELVQGLAGQRGLLLQAPVRVVWNASDRGV